jgi:hypothetical protein
MQKALVMSEVENKRRKYHIPTNSENVFLWQDVVISEGVRGLFHGSIEFIWGKERIMEVYLIVSKWEWRVWRSSSG